MKGNLEVYAQSDPTQHPRHVQVFELPLDNNGMPVKD